MSSSRTSDAESARLLANQTTSLLARIRTMLGGSARRACDSVDYLQQAWVDFLQRGEAQKCAGDEGDLVRRFCAIARNNVRDACRKRREFAFESVCGPELKEERLVLEQSSMSSRVARSEAMSRLHEATRNLPRELRTIVELRALEGQSFVDIARRLGRREGRRAQGLQPGARCVDSTTKRLLGRRRFAVLERRRDRKS
jgi:RNA polymerase sigma factor (sigma-70 family)